MDPRFIKDYNNFQKKTMRWIDRINAKPSYPWLSTTLGSFMSIPGLRGFWPMSSFDSNGAAVDLTGLHNLANPGPAQYAYNNLAPLCSFDGSSDYLWVADNADHDIIGNEGYVTTNSNGLSIGGWFQFNALAPANAKGIIGKWDATAGDRSYMLYIDTGASVARFVVSSGGAAVTASVSSTLTLSVETWYFIVGRYDPSTEVSITVNGTQNEDISTTTVPATLYNGAADFNIMSLNNGAASNRNGGWASFCFLSAIYCSDNITNHLYEMSRGMYGV